MDVFKTLLVDSPQVLADGTGLLIASNNLNDLDDASSARTNLGVAIGSDVQAHDADLDSWAGVTRASGFDTFAATPSSSNLAALVTDETGTGALVFANSPTLVTPALGTPASGVVTNLTGTASININGTVGATTPSTGAFTTLTTNSTALGAIRFAGAAADGVHNYILNHALVRLDHPTTPTLNFYRNGTLVGQAYDNGSAFIVGSFANQPTAIISNNTNIGVFSSTGLAVTGALSSTTGANFATSSGNVGIGTSSPANKIDVSESVSGNNNHGITITNINTAGWGGSLQFAHTLGGSTAVATRSFISSEGAPTGSIFRIATCIGDNPAAERLRIDASGNVGIGTTSPAFKLEVNGTFGLNQSASTRPNNTEYPVLYAAQSFSGAAFGDLIIQARRESNCSIRLFTGSDALERVVINGAGNVGIGTTSPAVKLDVAGTINSTGLAVTGTISSTGNLYIGTSTDVGARAHLAWPGVGDGTSAVGMSFRTANTGTSTAIQFVNTDGSPTEVGTITQSTTATAYNTSSDARLKTNIREYSPGTLIDSLQPRIFDWKSGEKDSIGFVAQELQAVYPQAVTAGDDGEEIEQQWGVDFAKLVPLLVAEVKALRARVAQLESNA